MLYSVILVVGGLDENGDVNGGRCLGDSCKTLGEAIALARMESRSRSHGLRLWRAGEEAGEVMVQDSSGMIRWPHDFSRPEEQEEVRATLPMLLVVSPN